LQTSTPEEQGVDRAALARLVAFGKTKSFDSLLVVRPRELFDLQYLGQGEQRRGLFTFDGKKSTSAPREAPARTSRSTGEFGG